MADWFQDQRKHGDVFPLFLSQFLHAPSQVLDTMRSLNRLAGYKFMNSPQQSQRPTVVQGLVVDHISSAFNRAGDCPTDLSPEKALDSLLRSKNLYAEEPSNLVPYDPEKLKILKSKVVPKRLESVVPPHVLAILRRKQTMIERSQSDVQRELSENPSACPVRPYWDPVLRHSQAARIDLIKRLHQVGIVEFRKRIKSTVGIFFVRKKTPQWNRMVIDARLVNFRHKTPPVARLGGGVNFTQLDLSNESLHHFLGADSTTHVGYGNELDVSDCFYQYKISNMAQWFGIDFPQTSGFWLKHGIDISSVFDDDTETECHVHFDEVVYPVIGAMAMGWSWALYLAHESVSFLARTASPCVSLEFRDKRPAPQLWHSDALVSTYVDNVSVIGATKGAVEQRCKALSDRFLELDIPIEWTYDEPQTCFETVGVVIDFDQKMIRNKPQRLWRIYQSAQAICRRTKIRPEVVEIWVGHATSLFRMAPHFLSVFADVYRFIGTGRGKRIDLWPSVRREIKMAASLVWLTDCSVGGSFIRQLDMGDSATHGYALMTRWCSLRQLHSFSEVKEKWRFVAVPEQLRLEVLKALDLDDEARQRELQSAFARAGVGLDLEYSQWLQEMMVEGSWLSTSSMKSQWRAKAGKKVDILVPSLIVPLGEDIVDPSKYKLLWSRKWRNSGEHINIKEARVLLSSLVRTSRVASLFGGRKCSASDNLAAILAFDKGRSSSQGLNKLCQKAAALLGATGLRWFLRHVETKRNVSDKPSRRYERARHSWPSEIPHEFASSPSFSSSMPGADVFERHVNTFETKGMNKVRKSLKLADLVAPPGLGQKHVQLSPHCCGSDRAEGDPCSSTDNTGHCSAKQTSKRSNSKPVFWEIFSGCGNLSYYMRRQGFFVLPPLDIKQCSKYDLTKPRFQRLVHTIIRMYDIDYVHFGTPCTVFSRARHHVRNTLRGREREAIGCELAAWTAETCSLLSRRGIKWSVENPRTSRLWEFPLIELLFDDPRVFIVDFDMCRYGTPFKKPTRILTNFETLGMLRRSCCHRSHAEVLRGRVLVEVAGKRVWMNRTTLAGAYPDELCDQWARISSTGIYHNAVLQCFPDQTAIGNLLSEDRADTQGPDTEQSSSIFCIPRVLEAITFGQHSRAEAWRRREIRRRHTAIKKAKDKIIWVVEECPRVKTAQDA